MEENILVPVFTPAINILLLIISTALVLFYQWHVMRHLPTVDCLPFKKGGNVLKLRKMPADAIPDKKEYRFVYEKDGKKQNFTIKDLPDSTWQFISREDFIIEKGKNNEPPIKDFNLTTLSGNDTTDAVLSLDASYYLFFVKGFSNTDYWLDDFAKIYDYAKKNNRVLYVVYARNEWKLMNFSINKIIIICRFSASMRLLLKQQHASILKSI